MRTWALMIKNKQGFILPIVLLFMQLFALLSIYELDGAKLSMQISRDYFHVIKNNIIAKQILKNLEQDVVSQSDNPYPCFISLTSSTQLVRSPLQWWGTHACSGNFDAMRYYYVLEWLGKNPCVNLDKITNNQLVAVNYYRLTLYVNDSKSAGIWFFQSTLVKPSEEAPLCKDKPYSITIGRQMWRELSS